MVAHGLRGKAIPHTSRIPDPDGVWGIVNCTYFIDQPAEDEIPMRYAMRKAFLTLAVCVSLFLSGCASNPSQQQIGSAVGGVLGGIGGALIGGGRGRVAAIILGTLIGATIGDHIGKTMDEVDRMKMVRILEHGSSHRASTWRNPDSGIRYMVTPRRTGLRTAGRYCREYALEARVGSRHKQVHGTACRQPDGSWQVRS